MKTPQLVSAAVLGLALLGGGFAAGMTVGRSGAATQADASASPSGGAGRVGARGGGAFGRGAGGQGAAAGQQLLSGRVISVNDGSITIEVRSAGAQGASPTVSSRIVFVGAATRIVKTAEQDITVADLVANDQVQIVATTDASGTASASAIVVGGSALQQLFGGPGGRARGASPSPSPTR